MTIQITIIGLGQIGGSIGLALSGKKETLTRVGHDKNYAIARMAEKDGAFDRVVINIPAAVRDADLVILALPMDQIRDSLEIIAPNLKKGSVVMDTSPVKNIVSAWASEILPEGCFYVGLTPVINPDYLQTTDTGYQAAHADLFQNGLIGITVPLQTPSEAIKLATDLTKLIGSEPFFADMLEMDSFMAATHILPQLVSAAMVRSTVDQPGWREARKVAGRAYAGLTGIFSQLGESKALSGATINNHENVSRVLGNLILALQSLCDIISQADGVALESELEEARQARERWWSQRKTANWLAEEVAPGVETPTFSQLMGRWVGLGGKKKWKK